MNQSLDDIANLAEDIGNRFLSKGKVNLIKIVKSEHISIIKGMYDSHFLGELVHYSRKFYIMLNTHLLSNSESVRVRFTIAHELGHYFIDEHRNKLKNGVSLCFDGNVSVTEYKQIEISANHFAANLLMPKSHFINQAIKYELGLKAIISLKKKFDTSFESTTQQYLNLNVSASMMIKWKADHTFHYAWRSKKFIDLTGLNYSHLPIRFDPVYIKNQVEIINSSGIDYIESVTPISRWISIIHQGTKNDILGLEQTIKLGEFGGITLLTFSNPF